MPPTVTTDRPSPATVYTAPRRASSARNKSRAFTTRPQPHSHRGEHPVMLQIELVCGPACSALTDERFLRSHYAELVSLGVGENGPGLGAGLPDVDPARPECKKTVNLLKTVCRAAGQVEMHTVLDRLGIGDRHEADADGCVLVSPDDDLPLALGQDLPAQRSRPEPGQAGQVVSIDDDVVKLDRHADSLQDIRPREDGPMSHVRRFDHVGLTVADLDVVVAFFVALGLEVEGRTFVEGEF